MNFSKLKINELEYFIVSDEKIYKYIYIKKKKTTKKTWQKKNKVKKNNQKTCKKTHATKRNKETTKMKAIKIDVYNYTLKQ